MNQYYIIFIQRMLSFFDIKYIMCDSFESMLIDLEKKDDITEFIDKKYYWNYGSKTFRTYLNQINKVDLWEYQDEKFETRASQHPNQIGYEIISQELYEFIKKIKLYDK